MYRPARHCSALLFFMGLIATLTFVFRYAVVDMFMAWEQEEYSYAYLIPFIVLILISNKMKESKILPENSWFGVGILAACLFFQAAFQFGGVRGILPEIYILSLIGAFTVFWGVRALFIFIGPLGLLMFCAPLPKFFYLTLSFQMQMLATSIGTALLDGMHIPVFQDGNIIDLGGFKLQVAEACNGIRYLFPLMSLSYLLAYLYKAPFIKRITLWVSAIPIAIFMNSARIALIGVTVNEWGQHMAEGLLHNFEGGVIFVSCVLCLVLEIAFMQKIGSRGSLDLDCVALPKRPFALMPFAGIPAYVTLFLAVIAAVISASPFMSAGHSREVPLKQSFALFPMQLGPWIGHFKKLDEKSLSVLDAQDYLLADYTKTSTFPVNLYALYYTRQDSSANESNHSPSMCIPGGGWTIASHDIKLLIIGKQTRLSVDRVIISKAGVRQLVYYWFIQGGQATPDANISKIYQIRNAMKNGITNGAMVRLVTEINGSETQDIAEARLLDFLNFGFEPLNGYMFGEVY